MSFKVALAAVAPDDAGHSMATLLVEDFDDVHASLVSGGFEPTEPLDGVISRVTQVVDPDGNTITLAEIPR